MNPLLGSNDNTTMHLSKKRNSIKNTLSYCLLLVLFSGLFFNCKKADKDITLSTQWVADEENPVITYGQTVDGAFWDNPDIIKDTNDLYQMYLSANYDVNGIEKKAIYKATSMDASTWSIQSEPVITPSEECIDLDFLGAYAPSVIFFEGLYHMYYSAQKNDTSRYLYIGHAVSSNNGVSWFKDDIVISPVSDIDEWNGLQVTDPTAVVWEDQVYLYYGAYNWRLGTSASPARKRIIGLSISEDGFTFDSAQIVHEQTFNYPASSGFEGYANPEAEIINKEVHLFYDAVMYLENETPSSTHIALIHSKSSDGKNFIEDDDAIYRRSSFKWTKKEIRCPGVYRHLDRPEVSLWFGGDNYTKKEEWGIGTATISDDLL